MDFRVYFILFLMYSFLGWLMEVLWAFYLERKLVDRGFLVGPICPIYGSGCILIILLLSRFIDMPVLLFVMTILLCTVLEYFTSYFMEKIFHARWWDYSKRKFNLNGRVCLETMIPFGILGTLIVYLVNPFFMDVLLKIPSSVLTGITIFLLVLFVIDFCVSFKVILNFRSTVKNVRDNTEEITQYVRDVLGKSVLNRRLVAGFPNFKVKIKKIITDIGGEITSKNDSSK